VIPPTTTIAMIRAATHHSQVAMARGRSRLGEKEFIARLYRVALALSKWDDEFPSRNREGR
jgi:3-deoxy-D-manno-octulosonic acid (KDO) 8-phosphate synthase